jgi:hypothetical protein
MAAVVTGVDGCLVEADDVDEKADVARRIAVVEAGPDHGCRRSHAFTVA